MKKMILEKPGSLILKKEKDVAVDGFVIEVHYCGICGADVKSHIRGHRDLVYPRVLGHEITGMIERLPQGYTGIWQVGDRVQVFPGSYCGQCKYCLSERENLCDSMRILGFHLDGGLSEKCWLAPEDGDRMLLPIPEGMSSKLATLAEPLACCIQMQQKLIKGETDRLLIVGAGRLGILQYLLAQRTGWKDIVVADVDPGRLKNPVFQKTWNWNDPETENVTSPNKPSQVILCTPSMEAFAKAIQICEKGGSIGYFSGLLPDTMPTKVLNEIHYKELHVAGSYGCTRKGNQEALQLLAAGLVSEESMSCGTFALQKTEKAMTLLSSKELHWAVIDLKKHN
ncbi:alcohol dehydrogenase catalytic domain-containing protein [Alkalibacter rhizosphaerae]|uniref:Alcohol dehydrogenase catalytic domain-containing protein n=1 Tax=Alkalibacter rhizosphaerae TaxID=2815577 RepID=A0A974XGB8_9FIRM|nr:alcohol dehydrogenase catalytic domain-containing protein [Alkalibacter rhizosphaerae]QSX09171.1 alcohol dehydrogenase catalytic domain-containing protein [Alkalibacter rhizosphaerae]